MSVTFYTHPEAQDAPAVNLNNRNASWVLDLLGLRDAGAAEWDLCGTADADDFLGRVLMATALKDTAVDDSGRPAITDVTPGGATWVEGGLPEGYFAERLDQLHEIATFAVTHKAQVCWA